MSTTLYLRSYLGNIRSAYNTARSECSALWDKLEAAQRENEDIQRSQHYTALGKQTAQANFNRKRDELNAELSRVLQNAESRFAEEREGADHAFGDLFRVLPEQIDQNALALLEAGVLTDGELIQFGEKYQDNPAMSRLVSKYAAQRSEKTPDNRELRRLAVAGNMTTPKHLEGIDTLTMWARKGLRVENRLLADGAAVYFDEVADQIVKDYGGISLEL